MRFFKPLILSLMILSLSAGLAQAKNRKYRGLDRNNDGVVTRKEWRSTDRSFDNQDWNDDGILSGEEVRSGAHQQSTSADRFGELDVNNDGWVSRGEWRGNAAALTRLDVDEDDLLSENEFNGRQNSGLIDIIFQGILRGR